LALADYLVKGFELEELRQRVGNLLEVGRRLEKENDALAAAFDDRRTIRPDDRALLCGDAPCFSRWPTVWRPTDSTVADSGERRYGERICWAQEIHSRPSPRNGQKLMFAVNCASVAGNADPRSEFIRLRARRLLTGAGAARKKEIRAGLKVERFSWMKLAI